MVNALDNVCWVLIKLSLGQYFGEKVLCSILSKLFPGIGNFGRSSQRAYMLWNIIFGCISQLDAMVISSEEYRHQQKFPIGQILNVQTRTLVH